MEKNVGGLDRTARLVIGAILAVAGIAAAAGVIDIASAAIIGGAGIVVGAILLVTGTTQKCPINGAAGINTMEKKQ